MTTQPFELRWLPRPRRRRTGVVAPLLLASTIAITANLTGVAAHAEAKAPPKPKPHDRPSAGERGKTVREAFEDAKRAAKAAAESLRTTLSPPALYTVQEGDTVPLVAERYGLNLASLLALNGLSWRTAVTPGQVLKLTQSGPVTTPEPEPEPEPEVLERHHTVAAGESLSAIAGVYGVALAWILSANGLSPSSIIYPGQVVVIPAGAEGPAPAVPTVPTAVDETPAVSGDVVPLTSEMRSNAAVIVAVGRELGVPDFGLVIALATAAQESTLRNLDWGDLDSVGLFRQRPSSGWGTVEQLTDPAHASRLFYGGPANPNAGRTRGLLDISGWQGMALTVAAQRVQISAYPDAYAKWEASAWAWLKELG